MNVALHAQHLNIISLCSGGGGLDLGIELAMPSARTICLVERESFAIAHLVAAMQAGLLAQCPVWSDVRTFPGRSFRGLVDGVIGGIPCQPHSLAGKRRGQDDERDLWSAVRRIIDGRALRYAPKITLATDRTAAMTRLKLGFSDRAISRPVWRALYRQLRIIDRECRHAAQDMTIFGIGYIKTGPHVPDFIRRVHPSNVAESLLETIR